MIRSRWMPRATPFDRWMPRESGPRCCLPLAHLLDQAPTGRRPARTPFRRSRTCFDLSTKGPRLYCPAAWLRKTRIWRGGSTPTSSSGCASRDGGRAADPAELRAALAGGERWPRGRAGARPADASPSARAVIAENPRPRGASRVTSVEHASGGGRTHPGLGEQLAMALGRLHGREREALALRFGAELSVGEIAELLDRTPAEVKQRLARGVRGLIDLGVLPKEARRNSAAKRPGARSTQQGEQEKQRGPPTSASATCDRKLGAARPPPDLGEAVEQAGTRGRMLRAQQLAHPVEAIGLGPIHVGLELVGEPPGLSPAGGLLGGVEAAAQPVGDRRDGRDDQQEREPGAHPAIALGRGRGLISSRLGSGGPSAAPAAGSRSPGRSRLAVRPELVEGLLRRGRRQPGASAQRLLRRGRPTAAPAVRDLLEVLVALRAPGRDRDRRAAATPASARRSPARR